MKVEVKCKKDWNVVILHARADAFTELYICCELCCDGLTSESFKYSIRVCKVQMKSLCFIKHCAMKAFMGVEVLLQELLTSALDRGECSVSQSVHFAAGDHWVVGWIGPSLVTALWRRAESLVCSQKLKLISSFVHPVAELLYTNFVVIITWCFCFKKLCSF